MGVGAILLDGTTVLKAVVVPADVVQARTRATATAPVAATMGTYTVWIRNDTAECRQGNYLNDANGSVRIRSRGLAPDNLTTVVLEVAMGGAPGGSAHHGHHHVVRARAVQLGQELLRRQHLDGQRRRRQLTLLDARTGPATPTDRSPVCARYRCIKFCTGSTDCLG